MSTPYLEKFLKDGGKPKKGSVIALERLQIHRFQEELCYALKRLQIYPFQEELCNHTREASDSSLTRRVVLS
jgi:hypothetical protein